MKKLFCLLLICLGLAYGAGTAHAQAYPSIPYALVESTIRKLVKGAIEGRRTGSESCPTIFCPDADWRIDLSADFRFTQNPQPRLVPLGPSPWLDGFTVTLDAQAEVTVLADAYIDINGPTKDIDFRVPVNKLIGIHFRAIVYTQPRIEIASDSIRFSLSDDGGNIEVQGLRGDLTILGVEAGAITGLIVGAGIIGSVFGAVLGNRAADVAQDKIKDEVQRRAATAIAQASRQMNSQLRKYIIPLVPRVNSAVGTLVSLVSNYY